jgi:Tol biopolymer transport system component
MNLPLDVHRRLVEASSLLALAACLLLAAPAQAAWSGKNGAIAFSRSDSESGSGTSDIWIETRTGEQRRLTATPGVGETSPTFSPDGRSIAYVRQVDESGAGIWLMRSDGSDKRPLVQGGQPSFFPSGRSLVYTVYDGSRSWDIRSIGIDGTGMRLLADNAAYPIVSPNGRWLAYTQYGKGGGIRLRDLRTDQMRQLTAGSAHQLDFSPNGGQIAFTGQRRCRPDGPLRFALLTIGLRDRRSKFLRRGCSREFISPAWSPNGKRIAFILLPEGNPLRYRLRMMTSGGASAGGAPRHRAGTDESDPSWQPLR